MDISSLSIEDIYELFHLEEEKPLLTLVKSCSSLQLLKFSYTMQTKLAQLASTVDQSKPDWTLFYSQIHHYLASENYSAELKAFGQSSSETSRLVGFKIFSKIQELIVSDMNKRPDSIILRDIRNSSIGQDNIAHIGGWVVYKILSILQSKSAKQAFGNVSIFEDICRLKNIIDKDAINDYTDHVEFQPGAMIRLTQPAVDFFVKLDSAVRSYETSKNIVLHRANLYSFILEQLANNKDLNDTYDSLPFPIDYKLTLYKIYVKMSAGQFRREVKRAVAKEIETRKAVAMSTKKRKAADKAPCCICNKHCARSSVICDFCDRWCHYKCAGLTGKEAFLKDDSQWKCPKCVYT